MPGGPQCLQLMSIRTMDTVTPENWGFLPVDPSLWGELGAGHPHEGADLGPSLFFRARKGHRARLAETVSRVL